MTKKKTAAATTGPKTTMATTTRKAEHFRRLALPHVLSEVRSFIVERAADFPEVFDSLLSMPEFEAALRRRRRLKDALADPKKPSTSPAKVAPAKMEWTPELREAARQRSLKHWESRKAAKGGQTPGAAGD